MSGQIFSYRIGLASHFRNVVIQPAFRGLSRLNVCSKPNSVYTFSMSWITSIPAAVSSGDAGVVAGGGRLLSATSSWKRDGEWSPRRRMSSTYASANLEAVSGVGGIGADHLRWRC